MNKQEAKFILRAYRPDGSDADSPDFEEALALVRQDPEFAEWFACELKVDATIRQKLNSVPAPSDLKTQILVGHRIVRPVRWWTPRQALSLAASVLVLAAASAFFAGRQGKPDFDGFRNYAANYMTTRFDEFDFGDPDVRQIRQWLRKNEGHWDFEVPAAMKNLPAYGCKILEWSGRKVSLVCFQSAGKAVHLFVLDRADLPNAPPSGDVQFSRIGIWETANWSRDNKAYVLTGPGDRSALKRML